MSHARKTSRAACAAILVALCCAFALSPAITHGEQQSGLQMRMLPSALSDGEFWNLVTGFSEPGGSFSSDNFTSNEGQYPDIVAKLISSGRKGGAYLGVGPEQNFHYIVAVQPDIAFHIDIRRQAMIQHLMYKAIFELSADRADFISLLFSRDRPEKLSSSATLKHIWDGYGSIAASGSSFRVNLSRIADRLTRVHGFSLSDEDLVSLAYVYKAFYRLGPDISYGGYGARDASLSFVALTSATDTASGTTRSFLATEESYGYIRDLQLRNLIVPIVGDFAGPRAIRSIADYLQRHGSRVNAFYVSNVESYLFQGGVAPQFYANVATLPLDSSSVFIRPTGAGSSRARIVQVDGVIRDEVSALETFHLAALCPIQAFIREHSASGVVSYVDAVDCYR
jgi:hypothetical protein